MTDIFGAVVNAAHLTKKLVSYINDVRGADEYMEQFRSQLQLADTALRQIQLILANIPNSTKQDPIFQEWGNVLALNTERFIKLALDLEKYFPAEVVPEHRIQKMVRRFKLPTRKKGVEEQMGQITQYYGNLQIFLAVLNEKSGQSIQDSLNDVRTNLETRLSDVRKAILTGNSFHTKLETELSDVKMAMLTENVLRINLETGLSAFKEAILTERDNAHFISALQWLYPDEDASEIEEKLIAELRKSEHSQPTWILRQDSYREWLSDPGTGWLWGMGRPGAGKTCIASFVANELRDVKPMPRNASSWNPGSDDTSEDMPPPYSAPLLLGNSVGIFYCSYQQSSNQDIKTILKCLCRQFLQDLHNINPWKARQRLHIVKELQDPRSRMDESGKLHLLLEALLTDFNQSYIIIDALDENDTCYEEVLDELQALSPLHSLRIFVTSRDGEGAMKQAAEIIRKAQNAAFLQIKPQDDEIRTYVSSRLTRIAESSESSYSGDFLKALTNVDKRAKIENDIVSAALPENGEGNYLCAELQITQLKQLAGKTLEARLRKLPATLDQIFRNTLARIEQGDKREIGLRALLWAIYGKRALTVDEISHALATEEVRLHGITLIEDDSIYVPGPQELVESTCYFLSIDTEKTTIQVHKAIQDYCTGFNSNASFVNADLEMAEVCLHYLSLDNFSQDHYESTDQWKSRVPQHPFFDYATSNWGWHLADWLKRRPHDNGQIQSVLELLERKDVVLCMGQALQPSLRDVANHDEDYAIKHPSWAQLNPNDVPIMPALHLLTYFKLKDHAKSWLGRPNENVDCKSLRKYTALWLACHQNYPEMVNLLLKHGADPTLENAKGVYCIGVAAWCRHAKIVRMLLEHKPEEKTGESLLRQCNSMGMMPISDAACVGDLIILQNMLDHMQAMEDRSEIILNQDVNGKNILHEATIHDQPAIIDFLLKLPEAPALLRQYTADYKHYPAHRAVQRNHGACLASLLKLDTDVQLSQRDFWGRTPLHIAAWELFATHSKIVELLMDRGADPSLRDDLGDTVLHIAARNGRPRQVQLLLRYNRCGNLFSAKNERGLTPLESAWKDRRGDWVGVMAVLAQAGAVQPQSTHAESTEHRHFDQDMPDKVYMKSAPVPAGARLPIPRVTFRLESHDQGFSSDFDWDDGSYHNSETWFEAVHFRDGRLQGQGLELTRNLRARAEWKTHEISWDADHGDLGVGSRPRHQEAQEEVRRWMKELRPGDQIAVVARARFPGWYNFVRRAEVRVYFVME